MSVRNNSVRNNQVEAETYTRREALAALAKYSAAVGGSAATIVTADGLVSAASAYWSPEKWAKFCGNNPTHWKCTGEGNSVNGKSQSQRIGF